MTPEEREALEAEHLSLAQLLWGEFVPMETYWSAHERMTDITMRLLAADRAQEPQDGKHAT